MRTGSAYVLGSRLLSMLAGCALVAACSSDRAYAPPRTVLTDSRVSVDVAASAGAAMAGELQDQSDYVADAGVAHAAGGASAIGRAPVCTLDPASVRWSCAPFVNANGLTVTRSFAYFDARGNATPQYDATTTARIDYRSDAYGPVGDGTHVFGVTHRSSAQTASGLLGAETTRVWDGAGVSADTVSFRDSTGTRHYAGVRVDTLRALTWAQPRQRGSFPLSGQTVQVANFTVTSQPSNETRSMMRRVVTTYNGSSTATIDAGHVTCLLHLDTHTVDGCH